jgi:hypothetical protein
MRALVFLVMLFATPALAEDQAQLAARIMALSETQTFDDLSPELRAIVDRHIQAEPGRMGTRQRLVIDGCLLAAEVAEVSLGFDYPMQQMVVDLRDDQIDFRVTIPLRRGVEDSISIISTGQPFTISFIRAPTDGAMESALMLLKAQDFVSEETGIYLFPVVRTYEEEDNRSAIVAAINDYRSRFCHSAS